MRELSGYCRDGLWLEAVFGVRCSGHCCSLPDRWVAGTKMYRRYASDQDLEEISLQACIPMDRTH